jgi:membrane-associated phospholipid phosphatase
MRPGAVRLSTGILTLVVSVALIWAEPGSAHAQEEPGARYDVGLAVDGAITGGLLAGTLLMTLVPVDKDGRWSSELFGGLDDAVKQEFSDSAAKLSDATLVLAIATPALLHLPGGWNRDTGRQLLLYGEAVSASVFLNGVTKYLVQRPRPYNYNPDARVVEYAREAGKDSHLSFYSGHASTAFAAAVAGSYLFASGPADREIKAVVWAFEMALAGATTQLRVRAGKHFYSDVLVGAVVGSAVGFLVPALHAEGKLYRPSGMEWMALAGGVIVGGATGRFLPLASDIRLPLTGQPVRLVPTADAHATGVALTGWF